MENRLEDIANNYEQMKIGLDEPFSFNCTMCGKCCIHRDDIILSPQDLYNISMALDSEPLKVVERYCRYSVGPSSRLPIITLKPEGLDDHCPLLKGHRCSVQQFKPTVCALFPLGRGIRLDKKNGDEKEVTAKDIDFILQTPECGDRTKTHTVREWLNKFGLPIEDECFLKWRQTISELSVLLRKFEKVLAQETIWKIRTMITGVLYVSYDMDKEFFPQFKVNAQEAIDMLQSMEILCTKKPD